MSQLAIVGCGSNEFFQCQNSQQCRWEETWGRCEPSGYCSFPSEDCAEGFRYGASAPSGIAGQCVRTSPPSQTESNADGTTLQFPGAGSSSDELTGQISPTEEVTSSGGGVSTDGTSASTGIATGAASTGTPGHGAGTGAGTATGDGTGTGDGTEGSSSGMTSVCVVDGEPSPKACSACLTCSHDEDCALEYATCSQDFGCMSIAECMYSCLTTGPCIDCCDGFGSASVAAALDLGLCRESLCLGAPCGDFIPPACG